MNPADLVHDRRGSGPPLVLLHGIGHHWRAWEPVLDRLAEHHDVIAVDLPGFGRSPLPESGLAGMPALVESLASFFTSLGIAQPRLADHDPDLSVVHRDGSVAGTVPVASRQPGPVADPTPPSPTALSALPANLTPPADRLPGEGTFPNRPATRHHPSAPSGTSPDRPSAEQTSEAGTPQDTGRLRTGGVDGGPHPPATPAGAAAATGLPHVAGNSLGGAIALELAAAGYVASATALSPAGFATARQLRYAVGVLTAHRMASRLPTPLVRTLFRSSRLRSVAFGMLISRPDRLTVERAVADAAALRGGRAFRAVVRASRGYTFTGAPAVPVTIAWGTRDLILPHRQAAAARRGLPDARHVDLPGCGHVPMSDDPDLVADVILRTTGARP